LTEFVLDCSVALAWVYDDETSPLADRVMERLRHDTAHVPGHWRLEISNGLAIGERRGRLTSSQISGFVKRLGFLPIVVDVATIDRALGSVLDLARRERLSAYDAVYLDLALRRGIGLATADKALAAAATRQGVPVIDG
jgi:predicted nucleic acid-binding protein